jgi:hypothetical protein
LYSREELEREGLTDFRVFLAHAWDHLSLQAPTEVQQDIAKYLQHGPRREVVEGFRGVAKSWITAAFVLWVLLLDPQKKIMVVSAGESLARDITTFMQQLIRGMPLLQHLAPTRDQRNSAAAFDVGPATPSKDPSVKSVGITGQLTGSRADVIVADDIETPKNSYTHLLRERLAQLVKEFDAVLKPDGRVIYLGTPQIEDSLYTRLWKDRGYDIRVWPSEVPANPSRYAGKLAPYILKLIAQGLPPGTPVEPTRFDELDLMERKASYGPSGYALQYLLDTTPSDSDRNPLKLKDLMVHDVDPEMGHVKVVWGNSREHLLQDLPAGGFDGDAYFKPVWLSPEMAKYTATVMAIDPSGRGSDETAYAVLKYLSGVLYLVAVGGFTDGFGEATLQKLAGMCLRWKVNDVIVETNYGGGMFNQLLKPFLASVGQGRIDEEWNAWSSTNKELRILDTLEPIIHNHRLVVDRRVIEEDLKQQRDNPRYSFIQQYTRMSRTKGTLPNEDRLEALSMAATYFTEKMNRDQQKALDNHKQAALDAELRKWHRHTLGAGAPQRLSYRPPRGGHNRAPK